MSTARHLLWMMIVAVAMGLPGVSHAQSWTYHGEVLNPSEVPFGAQNIGAPAVTYDTIRGRFIMVFEAQTNMADERCPQGIWALGFATSVDGLVWNVDATPLLMPSPGSGTYYSCVAAHPAIAFGEAAGGRVQVYFKAEQDTDGCGADPACPYTGIGRLRIQLDAITGDVSSVVVQQTTVIALDGPGGYPTIARDGPNYYMAYQRYPNVYFSESPVVGTFPDGDLIFDVDDPAFDAAGDTGFSGPLWVYDEFYSPSLICDDSIPFPWALWIGSKDTNFGLATRGAWGKAIRGALAGDPWLLSTETSEEWANNDDWRHWEVVRMVTGEYLIWYSEKNAGVSSIHFGGTNLTFNPADLQGRSCP